MAAVCFRSISAVQIFSFFKHGGTRATFLNWWFVTQGFCETYLDHNFLIITVCPESPPVANHCIRHHLNISHTGAKPGKASKGLEEDRNAGSERQPRLHRPWPLPSVVVAVVRRALYASVNRDHCPFTALCNEWCVVIYGSIKR